MEFNYDTIADAASLRVNGNPVTTQVELENGLLLSLGKGGKIAFIEILDFSKQFNVKALLKKPVKGIPITITHTRLMDEQYMKRHYPRYCAAQEKLHKRPWDIIWNRFKKSQLRK